MQGSDSFERAGRNSQQKHAENRRARRDPESEFYSARSFNATGKDGVADHERKPGVELRTKKTHVRKQPDAYRE